MENEPEKTSTRQKLVDCAVELFATKGYTETSIRELAAAVGVKEASLYNHFPSKNAILEHILEEFSKLTYPIFKQEEIYALKKNPTPEGILSCMRLLFPDGKVDYYLKRLFVILQEQHRNPIVGKFVSEKIILSTEQIARTIIQTLKDLDILRPDTDADFWVKVHSSLLYSFANRTMLGIGDNSPGFSGIGMSELLRNLYDLMLKTCGTQVK